MAGKAFGAMCIAGAAAVIVRHVGLDLTETAFAGLLVFLGAFFLATPPA